MGNRVIGATLLFALAQTMGLAQVAFDAERAWEHLTQLVGLGPRPAGSAAIERARTYIAGQLTAAGVPVVEQAWTDTTPLGPVRMVNLIATLPGARTDRLIIAGHYDTKLFREFPFVGANDGGSSAAFLIEMARVLKARNNELTIELVFFDGEEAVIEWQGKDRMYGSRHYVATAERDGTLPRIRALLLVDMIADRDLVFRRELLSTPWLTDLVWSAARRTPHARAFSDEGAAIEDDHVPFLEAGIPAVDLIDLDYAPWHTAGDTLAAVSPHGLQVVADVLLAALPELEKRLKR